MRIENQNVLDALAGPGRRARSPALRSPKSPISVSAAPPICCASTRTNPFPTSSKLLDVHGIPFKFLGGGSNLLVGDGELPWVVLQLAQPDPDVVIEGNFAMWTPPPTSAAPSPICAKHDLGGMEGLIGVPGTVGGALRMNAGAYGMQIGTLRPRGEGLSRRRPRSIEILRGDQISFEYRHTSFAPDDMMLAVKLELPSKPFNEILQGIRICNEKRRASQPLGQKSAGCIFKNPPGASAGRMIDELGLKGIRVGDARVSDRHANFFVNAGKACASGHARADRRRSRARAQGLWLRAGKRGGGLDRVKTISQECGGAADADSYRPELLADEEPRYLRRQKPVEIRRKKFAGRGWSFYTACCDCGFCGRRSHRSDCSGRAFLFVFAAVRAGSSPIKSSLPATKLSPANLS